MQIDSALLESKITGSDAKLLCIKAANDLEQLCTKYTQAFSSLIGGGVGFGVGGLIGVTVTVVCFEAFLTYFDLNPDLVGSEIVTFIGYSIITSLGFSFGFGGYKGAKIGYGITGDISKSIDSYETEKQQLIKVYQSQLEALTDKTKE